MAPDEVLLRDLLLTTKDGEWGKGEPGDNLVSMGVIRGTDFESVRLGDLAGLPIRFIPEHVAARKALRPRDILIETAGGTKGRPTGRTVYLRDGLLGLSPRPVTCASFSRYLRVNPELAEPEYVYWYLQHLYAAGEMEQHQVQHTGVARFQYTAFAASTTIPLPSRESQRSICDALRHLDELVALNHRRNRTVESIARAIFKSWFADDQLWFSQVATLPAPDGWALQPLREVIELAYGRTLRAGERRAGKVGVYGSNGRVGWHDEALERGPGVVVGRKGSPGVVTWVNDDYFPIDTTFYVRPRRHRDDLYYFYFLLDCLGLPALSADSAVPGLNRETAYSIQVPVPPSDASSSFARVVRPMLDCIAMSGTQSRTLADLRTALMPSLLGGGAGPASSRMPYASGVGQ